MQFAMMMQEPEEENEHPETQGSDSDIDHKTEGKKLKRS